MDEGHTSSARWAMGLFTDEDRQNPLLQFNGGAFRISNTVPPVETVSQSSPPRILLLGTPVQLRTLRGQVRNIAARRGIESSDFWVNMESRFGLGLWEQFFAAEDFLGSPENCSIPSLIITTGELRHDAGAGMRTDSCLDWVKMVSEKWSIPVEVIEPVTTP